MRIPTFLPPGSRPFKQTQYGKLQNFSDLEFVNNYLSTFQETKKKRWKKQLVTFRFQSCFSLYGCLFQFGSPSSLSSSLGRIIDLCVDCKQLLTGLEHALNYYLSWLLNFTMALKTQASAFCHILDGDKEGRRLS